ncbi:phage tail terminator-like protein [Rhodoplanes roseus]|uniref:phage tail terminator-like protein n=1 Tax=Rhodoplanes roseus TaxID=29409 RepID=UPI0014760EE7|nr:phage tail terminator-like protein [Rhodoplanes roseus]
MIDAVLARLGETWDGISVVPPNITDEAPADASPYIAVQFPASNVERMPVTDRLYREEGGFRLVLHMARGAGHADVTTKADALAALFRDTAFAGVETFVPSTPYIDDESGNYVRAAVVVPYRYQFRDA